MPGFEAIDSKSGALLEPVGLPVPGEYTVTNEGHVYTNRIQQLFTDGKKNSSGGPSQKSIILSASLTVLTAFIDVTAIPQTPHDTSALSQPCHCEL